MPATEAQIRVNQQNAARSTGPKTTEGKECSRRNALKHGLTGEGIVLIDEDAAEVDRRAAEYQAELTPSSELGRSLVRRIAVMSVRMDRSVMQETAALSERVRRAEDEFEAPEGLDDEAVEQLRAEAGRRALFDPSREACLARKYEAASERSFFRALKELRQVEREARGESGARKPASSVEKLGSFLPVETIKSVLASLPAEPARVAPPSPPRPSKPAAPAWNPPPIGSYDVPITIGRAR